MCCLETVGEEREGKMEERGEGEGGDEEEGGGKMEERGEGEEEEGGGEMEERGEERKRRKRISHQLYNSMVYQQPTHK